MATRASFNRSSACSGHVPIPCVQTVAFQESNIPELRWISGSLSTLSVLTGYDPNTPGLTRRPNLASVVFLHSLTDRCLYGDPGNARTLLYKHSFFHRILFLQIDTILRH